MSYTLPIPPRWRGRTVVMRPALLDALIGLSLPGLCLALILGGGYLVWWLLWRVLR